MRAGRFGGSSRLRGRTATGGRWGGSGSPFGPQSGGGGAPATPGTPTLAWTTASSDNTPGFDVDYADPTVGDVVWLVRSTDNFATSDDFNYTLVSVTLPITPTWSTGTWDDDVYDVRVYIARSGASNSANSNEEEVVIDTSDVTAPTITSSNTANNVENTTLSHALTANEAVTWSIVGGADQARFEISGSTLRWASNGTKDYESPNDADTNNTYVVTVRATDGSSNTTDQTITVTVTDADEVAPTITSSSSVSQAENATLSHSLTANETVTWSIVGGADQADFEISGSTLRWASNGVKDYEIPDDSDTNNTYVVTVRATDTASNTTDQTITVTVTDASDAWSPSSLSNKLLWLEDPLANAFQSNAGSTAISSDADPVGYWTDLSGNGFHLSSTGDDTTRPAYDNASSYKSTEFDGSNDLLRRTASLDLYNQSGGCSIFFTYYGTPINGSCIIGDGSTATSNPVYWIRFNNLSATWRVSAFIRNGAGTTLANEVNLTNSSAISTNTWYVIGITDDGSGQLQGYVDGSAQTTPSAYSRSGTIVTDRTALMAGIRTSTGQWQAGKIGAMVICRGVLGSTDRANLVTYLGNQIGKSL